MITLRLNNELEKNIENFAKLRGISKSELIRNSIIEYLSKFQKQNAWELGKDLFGKYESGNKNLSTSVKILFREKLQNKYDR